MEIGRPFSARSLLVDTDRFDNLLRSLSETPSRRGALRALGGLGLAGLFGHADAEAKKKKKKKKK